MSSDDQWPPVASASKGSTRINGNKRNIKEFHQEALMILNEMFGSILEPAVILSVVQNSNWELQRSVEGLITLSETVEYPKKKKWNDNASKIDVIASATSDDGEQSRKIATTKIIESDDCDNTVLPSKSEKPKRGGTKNRMGSFCGNIAKLKSFAENSLARECERSSVKIEQKCETSIPHETNLSFDDYDFLGAMGGADISKTVPRDATYGNFPGNQHSYKAKTAGSPSKEKKNKNSPKYRGNCSDKEKSDNIEDSRIREEIKDCTNKHQRVASFDSKMNIRKNESESLCGLKVQYRLSGMESSSDDDADVVIEDESSDYTINLTSVISTNVSQFLSPSTQTPPQRTKPEIHMINTPSPPQTPQRSIHDSTLTRIKLTINRGNKILILLRGLPGSGKTTLAKSIIATTVGGNSSLHIFSTDDFFLNFGHGVYQFDPTKLSEAHAINQKRVSTAMKEGLSPIIIDNTNIEAWAMRPYAAMAVQNGYIVEILEPNTPWARNPKELAEKNTHNVSKTKIRERASRFETITSGGRLLDIYGLKYLPHNKPPQMRLKPPILHVDTKQEKVIPRMVDIKSNWDNHQKNNFVLTSHDIESMQNIDEIHNSKSIIAERAIISDDLTNSSVIESPENSSNYANKVFNDYLQELQDSDDESFEILEGSGSEPLSDVGNSRDIEGSSGSQRDVEITKNIIDETVKDFVDKELSLNGTQQTLGAIGSERKGSVAHITNNQDSEKNKVENNGNVLSQCWDFTLILGRQKLHSKHGHYVSPFKILTNDSIKQINENISIVDENISMDEEETKLLEINAISQSKIIMKENLKLDKITDDGIIVNEDELVVENLNDDNESKVKETPVVEKENIVVEDTNSYIPTDLLIPSIEYNSQYYADNTVKELSKYDIAITEEIKNNEVEETSSTTTLGSLLNLIKTSILGGSDESSTIIYDKSENVKDFSKFKPSNDKNQDCSVKESLEKDKESMQQEIEDSTNLEDENLINQKEEDMINKNEAILIDLDTVDSPKIDTLSSMTGEIVMSADVIVKSSEKILDKNDNNSFQHLSTNPFREEMIKSKSDNIESLSFLTDNINSISWKESPFPIDSTKIPILPTFVEKIKVPKADAQTMTTFYDFNVAYIGGTCEPGYRELWGFSRSINEGTTSREKIENQGTKIMFDKSSMTGESVILANETNLYMEKEKDSTNRLDDLIEMFPHYPREYLKTLYEQQCNCNFDWVVDVLILADVPNLTIENYENKRTNPEIDDKESVIDSVKLWKIKNEQLKQRSHSSSPRNRRSKTKNFRSFSLESVENRNYASCETSSSNDENNVVKDDEEDKCINSFYSKAVSEANFPGRVAGAVVQNDLPEISSFPIKSGLANDPIDNDGDEIMELNFGCEFINQLENTCGNPDFSLPDEFKPVIKIKKSMLEELYGLWIQSMDRQMNALHAQLEDRMAKDEAMARAMDHEETVKTREPVVPNLEEIMNMEMALARYQNELKENIARETPNDMASRLTRQMLYELLPNMDQQILSDVLKAHDGNFKETCEIIEANIGRKISKTDTLKKQQRLLERVNEERKNRDIQQKLENTKTPIIVVNPDVYANEKSVKYYKDAIDRAENARYEAQKQFSLRIENYNKAAEAYRKGNPEVAAYYSQMVKLHTENIKAAHANAADEFLSAQMYKSNGEDTLDLHNLFVREALQALDVFLNFQLKKLNKGNRKSINLFIITGYGARSNNGLGKIKPAVLKKLISKNIRFTEANLGCLRVTLNKRNCMLV